MKTSFHDGPQWFHLLGFMPYVVPFHNYTGIILCDQ